MPVAPFLIFAGSTLLNAHNQNRARQRQSQALAQGIAQLGGVQDRSFGRLQDYLGELSGSSPDAARTAMMADFMTALRGMDTSTPEVFGANARYAEDLASAKGATADYGARLADIFSRIDAAKQQRRKEAQGRGRTATDLGLLGREAQAIDWISRLRAGQIAPNPWLTALSQFGQGYALNMPGNNSGTGGP